MKRSPALYLVEPADRPAPSVLRLPAAPLAPRETSWRDLVRRLAKNPLKQR